MLSELEKKIQDLEAVYQLAKTADYESVRVWESRMADLKFVENRIPELRTEVGELLVERDRLQETAYSNIFAGAAVESTDRLLEIDTRHGLLLSLFQHVELWRRPDAVRAVIAAELDCHTSKAAHIEATIAWRQAKSVLALRDLVALEGFGVKVDGTYTDLLQDALVESRQKAHLTSLRLQEHDAATKEKRNQANGYR